MTLTNPIKILLVEDEGAHAEAIRRAIKPYSDQYALQHVMDLREFRKAFAENPPDIVLTDLNLPDGKAFEILQSKIYARLCPILIITAFGDEELAVKAIKDGALDYIVKSSTTFVEIPRIIERSLREWDNLQMRRQAEEALRKSENKYRSLIENMQEGLLIITKDGHIIMQNPAVKKIIAIDDCYDENDSISSFYNCLDKSGDNITYAIHHLFELGGRLISEYKVTKPGNTSGWIEIHGNLMDYDDKKCVMLLLYDITDKKLKEKK